MNFVIEKLGQLFDTVEHIWEGNSGRRSLANLLILSYLIGFLLIELSRQGLVPDSFFLKIPTNHFYAIDFTFRLLLVIELIDLIFSLVYSVSDAVGKQIEILSLILLRETFKQFTYFDEPIAWEQVQQSLVGIGSDALGAIIIFVILGFYYRAQKHLPITTNIEEQESFINAKKIIALGLLVGFIGIGIYSWQQFFFEKDDISFFNACYTALIFADVLLVLISLRYASSYSIVFRNSGFAIATVLIRISLIAPSPYNAGLGVASALFSLGLTLAYNQFATEIESTKQVHLETKSSA